MYICIYIYTYRIDLDAQKTHHTNTHVHVHVVFRVQGGPSSDAALRFQDLQRRRDRVSSFCGGLESGSFLASLRDGN